MASAEFFAELQQDKGVNVYLPTKLTTALLYTPLAPVNLLEVPFVISAWSRKGNQVAYLRKNYAAVMVIVPAVGSNTNL